MCSIRYPFSARTRAYVGHRRVAPVRNMRSPRFRENRPGHGPPPQAGCLATHATQVHDVDLRSFLRFSCRLHARLRGARWTETDRTGCALVGRLRSVRTSARLPAMARDQVMTLPEPALPRFTGWLRPVVDAVARIKAGVHRKLLFGFFIGALLLIAMALLSLLVIRQMNDRRAELNNAQVKAGRAQEMLYAVTAQSHYRAMALLLPNDAAKYNGQVEDAKTTFAGLLDDLQKAEPENAAFYNDVRAVNEDYRESGQQVLALINAGSI